MSRCYARFTGIYFLGAIILYFASMDMDWSNCEGYKPAMMYIAIFDSLICVWGLLHSIFEKSNRFKVDLDVILFMQLFMVLCAINGSEFLFLFDPRRFEFEACKINSSAIISWIFSIFLILSYVIISYVVWKVGNCKRNRILTLNDAAIREQFILESV